MQGALQVSPLALGTPYLEVPPPKVSTLLQPSFLAFLLPINHFDTQLLLKEDSPLHRGLPGHLNRAKGQKSTCFLTECSMANTLNTSNPFSVSPYPISNVNVPTCPSLLISPLTIWVTS